MNPLIILLYLLLVLKVWPGFGEDTCSAFKDCCVSRLVTAKQFVCEKVCMATKAARDQLKQYTAELPGAFGLFVTVTGKWIFKDLS